MPAAANVVPQDLMNTMLGKIYDVIVNGDGTVVPKSEDNFFAWCTPGVPYEAKDFEFLTQGLTGIYKPRMIINAEGKEVTEPLTDEQREAEIAKDTSAMYMQAEQFARLVDLIPDASGIDDTHVRMNVKNNEGTLSDVYEEVLAFSQVANTELSAADKARIEKFRQLLQVEREKENLATGEMVKVLEPSPLVKAYNDKMQAWMDAALEYNSARIDALTASTPRAVHNWALNANVLRSKVRFALNDWVANGYKLEFEGIAARIDQMSSRDLSLLKAQYKDALAKARLTGLTSGSDFFFTALAPSNFAQSRGWTRLSFTNKDYDYYSKKATSSWGASGMANFGLFHIGGGAKGSRSQLDTKCDFSSFELAFEICQVPIVRPWFKSNFLTSKTWRFAQGNEGFKTKFLSDGRQPPHRDSMMPAYPTSMIFVRNLRLSFTNVSSVAQELESKIGGGGGFGWGPFHIGGGYQRGNQERTSRWHKDSQGITIEGLQCIGYKCHLLPKAPNPDPAITSWV
ncbi:MAG: hypothetical protein JNJ89_04585 [Rubrivivax sp.]|nr:hypothetical protein [Rubrivivax sp.]